MVIINVRADITYQQGVDKKWWRKTREDHYFPLLAHLGEQVVSNQEIYVSGVAATDSAAFGYQERYAEYRHENSKISGAFRSSAATPLDAWHLSQEFGSLPTLGDTFIQANSPWNRVQAVTTGPRS